MREKIKIGFLTERMLSGFGVDLVAHKTADYLARQGFKVTVFCLRADRTYKKTNYKIIELKADLARNPIKNQRQIKRLLKRLDYEEIDLWIAESYPFYAATQVMTSPVIAVDHGVSSTQGFVLWKKAGFGYIKYMQNYRYFPKAARIICVSKFIRSLIPENSRRKQTVIYNGGNNYEQPEKKEIENFRKKIGLFSSDLTMLYVGRLKHEAQPYKGVEELTEIYQELKTKEKNLRLVMAGFGDEEDRERLEKAGIIPLVSASKKEIALAYASADIYVSASKWEGFNLPLIEAGSFSLPAVVYDAGAHKEVLGKGAGYLVKNRADFKEKIKLLIEDETKRKEMSRRAKKNSKRFLWNEAGAQYENIIRKALDESKNKVQKQIARGRGNKKGWVDVIIVNYNGKKYLKKLLNSLKRQSYRKIKVTIVDNGSSDGSADYIKRNYSKVNLIEAGKNLFFSKANNLAVRTTSGEYILFLNNDTRLSPDAVEQMLKVARDKGEYMLAAIAPKIYLARRQKKAAGFKRYKEPGRILDAAGIGIDKNGSAFNRGHGEIDIGQFDRVEEVLGASFGAALARRLVFEKTVGPLDNNYYGYYEDIDWSIRARLLGYKIYSAPGAVVYHKHSGTAKDKGQAWKNYLIQANYLKTIVKNYQLRNVFRLVLLRYLGLAGRIFAQDSSRRISVWGVIKIWANFKWSLPHVLRHRFTIQRQRVIKDKSLLKFNLNRKK